MHPDRPARGSRRWPLVLGMILSGVALAAAAGATDGPGGTDTLRWVNPNGGAWTDAVNWSPANVPDNDNEVAVLDSLGAPYTVTLTSSLTAGGLEIGAAHATLDVSHGEFTLEGIVISNGTIRLSGGAILHVDRPLVQNRGAILVGEGSGSLFIRMPFNVPGTLDDMHGGRIVLDGGGLNLFCSELLGGTIERISGDKAVHIEYAVPQAVTIAPNTEVRVEGLMDITVHQTSLINNGTVIVSGTLQGTMAGYYNTLAGTGELILDQGRILTGNENAGLLINAAGHTIRGCGTILANLLNYGTIESDCDYSSLTIEGPVTNYGTIADPRGILWIKGSQITNAGRLSVAGGTMWIDNGASIDNRLGVIGAYGRPIEVGRGTTARIQGGAIEGSGAGTLHNQGTVTLQDVQLGPAAVFRTWPGATTRVTGARFTNQGVMRVQGTLAVDTGTDYVQNGGAGAATSIEGGSISAARGLQIESGALRGYGTVAAGVTSGGTVSPDPLLGTLAIQGDYHQLPAGRLSVGLAGSDPGQVSHLDVTGNATLDGTFEASTVGGFDPVPGTPYPVLSYGSVNGAFSTYVGNMSGELDIVPLYDADGMDLMVTGQVGVDPVQVPAALRFYGRREGAGASFVLDLPREASLTIRAYDARGREVARLADGIQPAGVHRFALEAAGGAPLPSGVYFARALVRTADRLVTLTARVVELR